MVSMMSNLKITRDILGGYQNRLVASVNLPVFPDGSIEISFPSVNLPVFPDGKQPE